ncbi:hypothetical protein N665_0041s0017 [Sinapis alba]|nr:hypothetical protein N665_0041s0017 [Sinapis alba]
MSESVSGDTGERSWGSANTVFLFLCLLRLSREKLGQPPSTFSSKKNLEKLDMFLWKRKDLERLDVQAKRQQHTDADIVGKVGTMASSGAVVIHFDHGGDRNIPTLVMKGRYEEITYSHLVARICKKINIDIAATKLQLSYFPLVVDNKRPCYILDDEYVIGYLMEVDKKNRRSVLHVELSKIVSENQSNEQFSMNEEILSGARANDGMVGVEDLATVPQKQ